MGILHNAARELLKSLGYTLNSTYHFVYQPPGTDNVSVFKCGIQATPKQ